MYYTKEFISSLAPKIRMPEEGFCEAMKHFNALSSSEAEEIAKYLADTKYTLIEKSPTIEKIAKMENGDLICVLLYMASAGYAYENYQRMGISDDIFYDSFNCLAEKMETAKRFTGRWGYPSVLWPARMTGLQTFRIGRLSYAMEIAPEDILIGEKTLVKKGADYVYIHIADNDKLCNCEESVRAARAFFAEFFLKYSGSVFYTRTWLLDPRLSEILPEGSNILNFQKVFNIFGSIDGESAILSRVFGEVKENLDEYVPTTSLAKSVLAYLKSGKRLGSGMGYTRF